MRIAWFSPLPPVRSGIASYSAELLPLLDQEFAVDRFVDSESGLRPIPEARLFDAHDFVWKQQREAYGLVVYQLGNARWHDYMWAYLARYPGLVVLHDARLHHARARRLLSRQRFNDYRREFRYDHPDAPQDAAEYAVEGLGGAIYYFWPMLRVVARTARLIAVHNAIVVDEPRDQYPGIRVEAIRMGVPAPSVAPDARARVRRELGLPDAGMVFAAFGKLTAEKRIEPILGALRATAASGTNAYLMLVGDASGYPTLEDQVRQRGLSDRVRITGYVGDDRVGDYLAAADACLCLRWPTAEETSASWLRALAAGRPTVITALAHLADIPTLDAKSWRRSRASQDPAALAIDLVDENDSLRAAMVRLSTDAGMRNDLSRGGRAYWAREHALEMMAEDYRRVLGEAAARPAPRVDDLPPHFTDDHTGLARNIARQLGVGVDILGRS